MAEYSQRYAETNMQAQSLWHLLSEAHILLRASLLQRGAEEQIAKGGSAETQQTDPQKQRNHGELDEALRQNCAQLGDCFSRSSQECHLALPYYRMSGLSVTDIIARNRPFPSSPHSYGPGFLFFLKHYLLEETEQRLSQLLPDKFALYEQ
eukprot:XP_011619748.1 PREDICTED: Hermansky-Pudlak syndrome 3 protein homolog isoform X2 [Takifugu rubripes]